jgi:hypothetical protein
MLPTVRLSQQRPVQSQVRRIASQGRTDRFPRDQKKELKCSLCGSTSEVKRCIVGSYITIRCRSCYERQWRLRHRTQDSATA